MYNMQWILNHILSIVHYEYDYTLWCQRSYMGSSYAYIINSKFHINNDFVGIYTIKIIIRDLRLKLS